MALHCSLFFFTFSCDFLNTESMGIPITHDVYMPWHLGDPFKSIEQTTHMMVFTMMIMIFPQSMCLCVRNPLLVSSGNVGLLCSLHNE